MIKITKKNRSFIIYQDFKLNALHSVVIHPYSASNQQNHIILLF